MTVAGLRHSAEPLVSAYDVVLLDLDGVVYVGEHAVPGAAAALSRARDVGTAVHFVTNNASRRAGAVAAKLSGLGVAAEETEVTTSAQSAAALLARRLVPGATVLVVGTEALAEELAEVGLRPTWSADDKPVALVQGSGRDIGWAQLAEAAVAVRRGALWVATNLDSSVPSARGPLPGNGAIVSAVVTATGRRPDLVVGKPEPALFEQAVARRHAHRPLVVGDRLDTDIEGAARAGMPSLLVLTGVTTPGELLAAPEGLRPSYVAADLGGLHRPHPAVRTDARAVRCGGWRATVTDDRVALSGHGDRVDALRAACAVGWATGTTRFDAASAAAADLLPADS